MTDTEKPEPAPPEHWTKPDEFLRGEFAGEWCKNVDDGIDLAIEFRDYAQRLFSPEDVALLEAMAADCEQVGTYPDSAAQWRSLASRIALLLPPPALSESR